MSIGSIKNSRILVTGAAGFLGRQLIAKLISCQDVWVLGIDQLPECYNEAAKSTKLRRYRYLSAEFKNVVDEAKEFLFDVPRERRIVFHMAGLADERKCHEHPDRAFRLNLESTFHVLEMCRQIGGTSLIFPSTGLVYGDDLDCSATEDDHVAPLSIYTATKIAAETLIQTYATCFALQGIIARLSNVYGPGVSKKTVIGRILDQASKGEPIKVMDETPVRDFIFSQDVIDALICLASLKTRRSALIINVSTGKGMAVKNVVSAASNVFTLPVVKPNQVINMSRKISRVVLSNEKIRRLTNWTPKIGITEGLRRSIKRNEVSE